MYNIIQRIKQMMVAGLLLPALLWPGFAQGAGNQATFNNMANDSQFLVARNATQGGSYTDPVNNANSGDLLDVAVYYHNTAWQSETDNQTAKNVRIKIALPNGYNSKSVLKGELLADNAATVTGTVYNGSEIGQPDLTINSTTPVTVNLVTNSVRWYPDKLDTTGAGLNLPYGQDGSTLITSGIQLGDIEACFSHSGYLIFKVKLQGQSKAVLKLSKQVKKVGESQFQAENTANPGDPLEYQITLKNLDGQGVARNLTVIDTLPAGVTYVGPTYLIRNGVTTNLPDGLTTTGIKVVDQLDALEQISLTFKVSTATSLLNAQCVVNKVNARAENSVDPSEATAKTCFVVTPPTPTPTPTPPVTPTPNPTAPPVTPLPKTGPELPVAGATGALLLTGTSFRYWLLKRKLQQEASRITIL